MMSKFRKFPVYRIIRGVESGRARRGDMHVAELCAVQYEKWEVSSSSGCLTGSWSVWSHAVTPHSRIYHLVFVI